MKVTSVLIIGWVSACHKASASGLRTLRGKETETMVATVEAETQLEDDQLADGVFYDEDDDEEPVDLNPDTIGMGFMYDVALMPDDGDEYDSEDIFTAEPVDNDDEEDDTEDEEGENEVGQELDNEEEEEEEEDENGNSRKLLVTRPGTYHRTIYSGYWGSWKGWNGDNTGGYYVCGAEIRYEGKQGWGDDTAANGLRFKYCHIDDWWQQTTATVYDGNWGGWKGMQMCPYGYYMDGAQVRYESKQGAGDDTALNGLKIHCRRNKSTSSTWVTVYNGYWGSWKPAYTHSWKFVKLANVRYENPCGVCDDTAWNGLALRYEIPNNGMSQQSITGKWQAVASGPFVEQTMTQSSTTTESKSLTTVQEQATTAKMSAGFVYKLLNFGVNVNTSYSTKTTSYMSSTITLQTARTVRAHCGSAGSPTGTWVLWQWVMDQPSDAYGPGVILQSNHYRCTHRTTEPPRCPLGACRDGLCQTCYRYW